MKTCAIMIPTYWPTVDDMLRLANADILLLDDYPYEVRGPAMWNTEAVLPQGTLEVPMVQGDTAHSWSVKKSGWRGEHIATLCKWYPGKLLYLGDPLILISSFPSYFSVGAREIFGWLSTMLPPRKGRKTVFMADYGDTPRRDVALKLGAERWLVVVPPGLDITPVAGEGTHFQRSGPLPPYSGSKIQQNYSVLDLLATVGESGVRQYLAQAMEWEAL